LGGIDLVEFLFGIYNIFSFQRNVIMIG